MDKARNLRHEGEKLLKKGKRTEAINRFEKSLEYFPDKNLAKYIQRLKSTN